MILLTDISQILEIFFPLIHACFIQTIKIATHFESGLSTGIIDLQRAFDTVHFWYCYLS